MRLLIVNDDGIDSVGIRVLADVFRDGNEITVVAPMNQRSGFSHSITIGDKIDYVKAEREYTAYAISGTPADCTKTGVLYFNDGAPFELVLSGINNGSNLGTDILYSGTVAAATEGATHGIPSIAISLEKWDCDESVYREAAEFVKENIDKLLKICAVSGGVVNVNYPVAEPFKGVKLTKMGINLYNDRYAEENSGSSVRIVGQTTPHTLNDDDCDVELIKLGYATVTPLTSDRNDFVALEKLKGKNIFD